MAFPANIIAILKQRNETGAITSYYVIIIIAPGGFGTLQETKFGALQELGSESRRNEILGAQHLKCKNIDPSV